MPDPMLQATQLIAICKDACAEAGIDYDLLSDDVNGGLCKPFVQLVAIKAHKQTLTRLYEIALYRTNAPEGVEQLDPDMIPPNREMLAVYITELALISTAARALMELHIQHIRQMSGCPEHETDPNHWMAHAPDVLLALYRRFTEFDQTKEMAKKQPTHTFTQERPS